MEPTSRTTRLPPTDPSLRLRITNIAQSTPLPPDSDVEMMEFDGNESVKNASLNTEHSDDDEPSIKNEPPTVLGKKIEEIPSYARNGRLPLPMLNSTSAGEITRAIKTLVEILHGRTNYILEKKEEHHFSCPQENSLPPIPLKKAKKQKLKIGSLFKAMYDIIRTLNTIDGQTFLQELMASHSSDDTLREFLLKYGKNLEPEQLQDLIIVIQGLNGYLYTCADNESTTEFVKSLRGAFKLIHPFEHTYKTYLSIEEPPAKKNETPVTVIQEFRKLIERSTNVIHQTSNLSYYKLPDNKLYGKTFVKLEMMMKEAITKSLLYLELAHGIHSKQKNHFVKISAARH